ncbi:MAG: cell division protein FtsA [Candidatus Liptonbacteria bacterium]
MASDFVLGLDIGTQNIKLILAENVNGRPRIRAAHREQSFGLRKGVIVDLPEASSSLARAFGEVRKISKSALSNIYVSIGTHQTRAQSSRGIVAVSRADSEIYEDDIERVVKASESVIIMPNRITVHNVTREYIIDGVDDIIDPLGLSGSRLEVDSLIIDAFAPHVKNVMRIVELTGGRIGGLVSSPIASARAALSKQQKELGVALIDIGAGATSMCVYEENKLLHVVIFPMGAANITNDLAVGLKIPVTAAEALKLHYGYALASEIGSKESIDMRKFTSEGKNTVPRRFVAEIIEARLAEVFELVNAELKSLSRSGRLAGGAVLVGGGARLPGVSDLAKHELKLSVQVGATLSEEWAPESDASFEYFEDPEFVTSTGLVLWGAEKSGWRKESRYMKLHPKNLLKYFLP